MSELLRTIPLGAEAAFPKGEFDARVSRLQEVLAERDLDLYITTGPENIFYLTGQQTPGYSNFQSACVPRSGAPFLVSRGTEAFNARLNSFVEDIHAYGDGEDPGTFFAGVLEERGLAGKRIAVDLDAWYLSVNLYRKLRAACGELHDGSGLVERFRRVKSPLEDDRPRGLHRGLPQASRLLDGHLLRARLGRGQHHERAQLRGHRARARNGVPPPDHVARVLHAHRCGQRDHSDHGGGMPELELIAERARRSLNDRHDSELRVTFESRAGERLMFHGQRVPCGRTAYMPGEPARFVLTGSVDLDEFRSTLRLSTEPAAGEVPSIRVQQGMAG